MELVIRSVILGIVCNWICNVGVEIGYIGGEPTDGWSWSCAEICGKCDDFGEFGDS